MVVRPARIAGVIAIALAGCDRDPIAQLSPLDPVSVSPQNAYAGAPVTIKSARFSELPSVEVWADTFQLAMLARGGDSVVVELPRRARGSYTLQLGKNGLPLGGVEIAGYVGFKAITKTLGLYLGVNPIGVRASVIAGNYGRDGFAGDVLEILPGTGAVSTLMSGFRLGDAGWQRTPGSTPDPSVVLLQPITGNLQAWRLLPVPRVVDTLPYTSSRHAAVFNDSTYFRALHHWVESVRPDGRIVYHGTYEETHEVIISPTNDRATLRVNGSATGPPVFNTASGDTAYHVRQLFRSYGAAFSPAGDTLWMLGVTRDDRRSSMVMLNARRGELLKQVVFDDIPVAAMRRDPNGGRIFILAWEFPESTVDLIVIDEQTLDVIGHVEGPVCDAWCDWSVVAIGIDGVFVVHPQGIFEFEYGNF
jgi:hypothetical protein